MAHHAFYLEGEADNARTRALSYVETELGLIPTGNPDVISLNYGLFSVEHARSLAEIASQAPARGTQKVLIVSVSRLFHEAQNALLKLFEEPPADTTLILILPSAGILLPTLRSRLLPLPTNESGATAPSSADAFLRATPEERAKLIDKLIERTKSDKDDEKQAARREAVALVEGLLVRSYGLLQKGEDAEVRAFASDLDRFLPILHERSAPLKLIFEHLQLVWPKAVDDGTVRA
jgi:DNA polymerase III delta prime subunit